MAAGKADNVGYRKPPKSRTLRSTLTTPSLILTGFLVASGVGLVWLGRLAFDGGLITEATFYRIAIGSAIAALAAVSLLVLHVRRVVDATRRAQELRSAMKRTADVDLTNLKKSLKTPSSDQRPIEPLELSTGTRDEVGMLSWEFAHLHRKLVQVADQQMEMLSGGVSNLIVSLAQRTQSLVDRQIQMLDALEAKEEDPRVLGSLYDLDHLATQIRRNSESLLAMTGDSSIRPEEEAILLSDVVRGAAGEIEDFKRVRIGSVEECWIDSGAAVDVSHLLAEILTNAIGHSPSHSPVDVSADQVPSGMRVTVLDRGQGMPAMKLARLNKTLAEPPPLGAELEPTMGVYLMGRLAALHGVSIEMVEENPGLRVEVVLPDTLILDDYESSEVRTSNVINLVAIEDEDEPLKTRPKSSRVQSSRGETPATETEDPSALMSALSSYEAGRSAASEEERDDE